MDKGVLIEKICGRYVKPCPECNELQSYLRLSYAKKSLELGKVCKKCSNKKTENCHRGFYECIPITWFKKCKISSEVRGLEFIITIEDVFNLFLKQNKKCALSGIDLYFEPVGQKHIISIDRIDSSKGYTIENIQLIHKDLNFMKQQFSQEYFIEMCKLVAKLNPQVKNGRREVNMYNCNFVAKKLEHNNSKPTKQSGKVKVSKNKPTNNGKK